MSKVRSLAANRTEIEKSDGTVVFVSYSTPVAALIPGRGFFRTDRKYSTTTSKHITQWLDGRDATVQPQAFFDALL